MRRENPIWRAVGPVTGNGVWFLVNYDDVVAVLKDQRFIKDVRKLSLEHRSKYVSEIPDPIFEPINRHLLSIDPPDHTRLRALVHKAFTPRRVQDLKPRIEQIADELLTNISSDTDGDLINDYAFILPITVIAEMLGVETDEREKFRSWTQALLFDRGMEEASLSALQFVQLYE